MLAQNADITAETGASSITAIAGRDAFESNFEKFKEPDLLLLEPIIDKIIDYRKTFADLEAPCTELNKAIDSLV